MIESGLYKCRIKEIYLTPQEKKLFIHNDYSGLILKVSFVLEKCFLVANESMHVNTIKKPDQKKYEICFKILDSFLAFRGSICAFNFE